MAKAVQEELSDLVNGHACVMQKEGKGTGMCIPKADLMLASCSQFPLFPTVPSALSPGSCLPTIPLQRSSLHTQYTSFPTVFRVSFIPLSQTHYLNIMKKVSALESEA